MNDMITQLQQFMQLYKVQNAQAAVEKLIREGKINQSQLKQLSQQANQIINMLKMFGLK